MKTIHWLIPESITNSKRLLSSDIASIRLRAGIVQNGYANSNVKFSAGEEINYIPNILVIGKITASDIELRKKGWLEQILFFKENGSKIVLDYTDDHLNLSTAMAPFYSDCLSMVDYCICSSNYLYNSLKILCIKPIIVIPDAIDLEAIEPCKKTNHQPVILWFGHASNIEFLLKFLNKFDAFQVNAFVYILTNQQGITKLQKYIGKPYLNLNIKADIWSQSSMIKASSFCDICIIPVDIKNPKKAGASSNRLISAIALGIPVAANLLDSYIPYKKYFVNLDHIKDLISLIKEPESFYPIIREAQSTILPQYSTNEIFKKWAHFFESIT